MLGCFEDFDGGCRGVSPLLPGGALVPGSTDMRSGINSLSILEVVQYFLNNAV